MTHTRTLAVALVGVVLSTHELGAQDFSRYRNFQLGGTVPSVTLVAKAAGADVKTIHSRPALIQLFEWRPPYFQGAAALQRDSVRQVAFTFYNDQLSRIAVDYESNQTTGMTNTDMIEALSTTYGAALIPPVQAARATPGQRQPEAEDGTAIARWGDADHSIVLYRITSYASGFRVVVSSPRLEALTLTAADQAIRLDAREAPQRESARQKQEQEDVRAAQEKARIVNKAAFRP